MNELVSRRAALAVSLLAASISGCSRPRPAPTGLPPDGSSTKAPLTAASDAAVGSAPPPSDPEAPYRCVADGDCVTTCRFGALSAAWWRARGVASADRDCEDGCSSKGLVARCEHGTCATYDTRFGGTKRADDCTRRPVP